MSQHDFIFSNQFRHRIARHGAFWFACYFFYLFTFYVPYCVFPAWNTELFHKNISRLGFVEWAWWRIFNSTISFIPLMAFAYTIMYIVLPRHFFNKKNWVISAVLVAGMLILIVLAHYFGGVLINWNNLRLNPARVVSGSSPIISNHTKTTVLFNYPIVAGFAVIIKMMKRGWLKQQETEQIAREKAKTELQILKGQIHPHFLFNTLNNIYFFTLTFPGKAVEMLTRLTGILRYIIYECGHQLVPLEKELDMIKDYIALEKIRYGDRLRMTLEINGDYTHKMISPLLLIPLVENSFKHGASKILEHPWVNLNITIDGQFLLFLISNSRPDVKMMEHHNRHIGLNNVRKRLQLLYPAAHELNIAESTQSFEVFMKIRLEASGITAKDVKTELLEYAVA